jgi:acetyl-CoA carboxylase biotin carboxyl carrier protein
MADNEATSATPPARKKGARTPAESGNSLSISDIKELFVLMQQNEIAELQLEQQETRIHIVSKGAHANPPAQMVPVVAGVPPMSMVGVPHAQPGMQPAPAPAENTAQQAGGGGQDQGAAGAAGADASAPANLKTVFSPMVGTFYSAPAPDAPPFVRVGESVSEETVLCIIEAMKLMNEIKAEMKGRIYKMLVENGNPVEYNQPLFLIEP